MKTKIDATKCSNFNNKNGKCKIPHFEQNIKFTSCYCDQIGYCYYKRLMALQEKIADIHILCNKADRYGNVNANKVLQTIEGNKSGQVF